MDSQSQSSSPGGARPVQLRVEIGCDHAGVELRNRLVARLRERGIRVGDVVGPQTGDERVDYPDIAHEIVQRVAAPAADERRLGVLVCGTGQGVAIAANRDARIRAAVCGDVFSAKMARAHNDANILCLGARVVGIGLAEEILEAFLATAFEGGRHAARVAKLT